MFDSYFSLVQTFKHQEMIRKLFYSETLIKMKRIKKIIL